MSQQASDRWPDDAFVRLVDEWAEAKRSGLRNEANEVAANVLAMAAASEPSLDLALRLEAGHCEALADWDGAELAYQRAALDLVLKSETPADQYKVCSELSTFYGLLGKDSLALEFAVRATEAARRTTFSIIVSMALDEEATCLLCLKRADAALRAVDEALQHTEGEKLLDIRRGQCLVTRADCRQRLADIDGAQRDLDAAWKLLAPEAENPVAAGVHSALAHWWSITARMRAERGEMKQAVDAWSKVVDCRRHLATLPHAAGVYAENSLAAALQAYGDALRSAGYRRKAQQVHDESSAIRKKIALPPHRSRKRKRTDA